MIYPKRGDTIEYHVKFVDETPKIAKVLKTSKTFEGNWLFKCDTYSGWINFYHITKIIQSSKITPKPYNVHKFDEKDIISIGKRNQLTGTFRQILYYAAKRIPYKATRFIDYQKAIKLYKKQERGLFVEVLKILYIRLIKKDLLNG